METQTDLKIRHAKESDLPSVMKIYDFARRFMAEHGNPRQWGSTNWPPESLIKSDIESGKLYVCTSGENVTGVFFFDFGKDIEPSYLKLEEGTWKDGSAYGVVHRIASDGKVKGVGSFCINWAFEKCRHLRIDTHLDNVVMQNLLAKIGFEKRGIIHVQEDNDPRFAYEKV